MRATRMTIGDVARMAGVGIETIRFYERKGLIRRPPKPREGFRVYPQQAVVEIAFIRQAQDLGFSLREIGELMALRTEAGADCRDVRRRCESKLQDVQSKIRRLHRMEAALVSLIAACPGRGALVDCTIMDALAEPSPSAADARGNGMESIGLTIEGMHCRNCAARLNGALTRLPGVEAATVSHRKKTAEIVYDPATVSPEALRILIEDAGFSAAAR